MAHTLKNNIELDLNHCFFLGPNPDASIELPLNCRSNITHTHIHMT